MNKNYEKEREDFFTDPGETMRRQYVWAKNEKGKWYLQETEPINIQAEIESYADECDIKNIVRKASFDPEFLRSLQDVTGAEIDISEFPTNIHEYHQMMATAQVQAAELEKAMKAEKEAKPEEIKEVKAE